MKKRIQILLFIGLAFCLFSCGTYKSVHHQPITEGYNQEKPVVTKYSDTLFSSGTNYLIKNKQQLWELYVSGDALQLGLINGALSDTLIKKQERVFFTKIKDIIPSKFKQRILRNFLKWYNRKLYLNVPEEYQTEIYGVSRYNSDDYQFIAPNYLRSLYLHAAHDIGHALQDLALVGCSSMAAWGDKTTDGELLIGRNFDFYAGDEFAQDKIVAFVRPEKGHPFMSVTWGGMIGVVSGMNLEGLTVTINSGKSEIPFVAKTPISIVAREILQYASTIDEAIAIAKNRAVFVSESIMIGSAHDKKAVLIEVSPEKFGVYEVVNSNQLVCSNHFQSDAYQSDERNKEHIVESHSKYRFDRMLELLAEKDKMDPQKMAEILRNTQGLKNTQLGYGNEKSVNQLLTHHSVIFKPESRMAWVSSNPYQLGEFVAYDLKAIFSKKGNDFMVLGTDSANIPKDPFLSTAAYRNYEEFRCQDRVIDEAIKEDVKLSAGFIKDYQNNNPDFWRVYFKTGKYYYEKGWDAAAKIEFEKALAKEITTVPDRLLIEDYLRKINNKR
ncbi:peptidase C45, acyl-coenzyme A:6-aminopenicillanic acid acyl-transferase [Flavobacterium enshiense DK69]|uniref:Acyl-CoA:6-aminopenicillanic acid acyl-transferase n=1 Tax=Flavobacterium enshiense DK69 TaxID=1107311 RepID=V6SHA9_9FLAO|nr:C45 family peptidase [Flavobacterium enshiense]ESU23785.1 peptidase C45, acyl-coenzyme A:6-aminopenicillanic acid acyl-transferase [Flavobacterium enshiense DK69]KGO96087.1 acyl-CoA:6-aminopenicillanic acid acyl-transferase [Flavobacterium enshiense DK69]